MKIVVIVIMPMFFMIAVSSETPAPSTTFQINVNVPNTNEIYNTPKVTATTTTSQNLSSMVSQQWQLIQFDEVRKQIEQLVDRSKGEVEHAYIYYINNKKKVGFCFAAIGYGYIFYQLLTGHYYLVNETRWAMWKQGIAFAKTEEEISQELLLEIQQRYLNIKNPTDFLTPLVLFLQAVEEEIKQTTYYHTLYNRLNQCYCLKLFPINYSQLSKTYEKKERLLFLKNILQLWIARHNIQANKK